ncbi:serine--tRNA ligase [Lentibacter sp. XHP0401]|uniref:serine--tRNA ligase n=1 Tax=Lentibacter sp. XHP0401 TaxID=2984334 RepID=UPI0021E9A40B|nr:serine--tRNA ligase [Lentibacter sp. XHP0401]MCV2891797.1 serine--tRNA ligase [Lentibacter sp. XHP0401]
MHDIRAIRDNPSAFDAAMQRRGLTPVSADVLKLDEERRMMILAAETAQASQNKAAKDIGAAKAAGDETAFNNLREEVAAKKAEVSELQASAKALDNQLYEMLSSLPNLVHNDVPDGADENDNVEIRHWGTPREIDFEAREHFEIEAVKTGMDFETAAKLSGSRFVVLSGSIARLHRALAQFMLDTHIEENGLEETWAPVLVKEEMMYGTGQLPKFGEDSYQTTNGWWLVPTAEVPLTNMVNGTTLEQSSLPRRYVAHTQCFRSEAGSAGRDTSGMLRQHQFEKVEMVSITHPDESLIEHDRMTRCAEGILEKLGLPYRTVILCTGDIGFGAIKTHDIEVWLPGQGKYREISSVSVCGDFQARRMQARFKPADGGKPQYVHTLNGSGLAVGRALIAVLENGQQQNGSVSIPAALTPYLGGRTVLNADGTLA